MVSSILSLLLTIVLSATSCNPTGGASSLDNIQLRATINGLEEGEKATLTISHEGSTASKELFFERDVISDGEKSITVDIAANLKDGYYQLLLEAPDKYFRDPKGYFFMTSQSQIINPTGRSVIFNLLPQPEGPVTEAYISLSAPTKQPPPPPPFKVVVSPEEAYYLPGELVEVKLSITNKSSDVIVMSPYPPEIRVTPWRDRDNILASRVSGTQSLEIKPDETVSVDFTWDQKDTEVKQVPSGWYAIAFEDINVTHGDRRITFHRGAAILIQYPQGEMEKTIELEQSQTANGVTVTLERVELTTTGMTVYAFGTLPNYRPPPAASPFMHVFAEFSVNDDTIKPAGSAGMQELENGTRLIWSRYVDPVPSDAKELTFSITTITLRFAPGMPDDSVDGPWEFKVPLE
jgi:hypothetical protein